MPSIDKIIRHNAITFLNHAPFYLIPTLLLSTFRITLPHYYCDDAYITFKSSLNLASGNGLTFNCGERIYIVTTPLWAFILSLGISAGFDIFSVVRFACIFFEIVFLCSLVYLGYLLFGNYRYGLLAAILFCTHPVYLFNSLSGMETSLYLFVVTLTLIFVAKGQYNKALTFASLSIWARFDGLLLFLIITFWAIYKLFGNNKKSNTVPFTGIITSVIILLSYFLFGYFYYKSILPNSILAKQLHSPPIFSPEWLHGAYKITRQIANSIILGRSTYFYPHTSHFWIFAIMIIPAAIRAISERKYILITPIAFSFLYSLAFILSGNFHAQFYPWYFAPSLLGAYILSSYGFIWLVDTILFKYNHRFSDLNKNILLLTIIFAWVLSTYPSLIQNARNLEKLNDERENLYKISSLWAAKYLPTNSTVAAYEIGVIGFYLREDIRLIDLFGIHRKKCELNLDIVSLIEKYNPDMILVGEQNECREIIESNFPDDFVWLKYKKLDIGIKNAHDDILISILNEISQNHSDVQ